MKGLRPHEYPLDRCVTGPHVERGDDGELRLVFRCRLCGTTSPDPALQRGCWNCDARVGWR